MVSAWWEIWGQQSLTMGKSQQGPTTGAQSCLPWVMMGKSPHPRRPDTKLRGRAEVRRPGFGALLAYSNICVPLGDDLIF